jgi:hypothetical protein
MKPFNLEDALAGKPVVTRDGVKVEQINLFTGSTHMFPLFAVIDGRITSFNENGRENMYNESKNDLFMVTEKITKWVNVFRVAYEDRYNVGDMYDTEEKAKEMGKNVDLIATVPITFEI